MTILYSRNLDAHVVRTFRRYRRADGTSAKRMIGELQLRRDQLRYLADMLHDHADVFDRADREGVGVGASRSLKPTTPEASTGRLLSLPAGGTPSRTHAREGAN